MKTDKPQGKGKKTRAGKNKQKQKSQQGKKEREQPRACVAVESASVTANHGAERQQERHWARASV
jgi:hypothetical protein